MCNCCARFQFHGMQLKSVDKAYSLASSFNDLEAQSQSALLQGASHENRYLCTCHGLQAWPKTIRSSKGLGLIFTGRGKTCTPIPLAVSPELWPKHLSKYSNHAHLKTVACQYHVSEQGMRRLRITFFPRSRPSWNMRMIMRFYLTAPSCWSNCMFKIKWTAGIAAAQKAQHYTHLDPSHCQQCGRHTQSV